MTQTTLMKPAEVARLLRVSLRHVNRMKSDGRLRYVRIGPKTIRYYRDSVEQLLEQGDNACN